MAPIVKGKGFSLIFVSLIVLGCTIGIIAYTSIPPARTTPTETKDPILIETIKDPSDYLDFEEGTLQFQLGHAIYRELQPDDQFGLIVFFGYQESLYWSNGTSKVFVINYLYSTTTISYNVSYIVMKYAGIWVMSTPYTNDLASALNEARTQSIFFRA